MFYTINRDLILKDNKKDITCMYTVAYFEKSSYLIFKITIVDSCSMEVLGEGRLCLKRTSAYKLLPILDDMLIFRTKKANYSIQKNKKYIKETFAQFLPELKIWFIKHICL